MSIRVDTMRRIDFLVGVPLCILASAVVRLGDLLRPRHAGPPRRMLLIELSEMGSAVLADPAMREAAGRGAELYFLIFAANAKSLELLGTVPPERVLTIRADSLANLAIDTLRALWRSRRLGIDTVVDLELFSRFSALLTGLCGASRRVGFHAFHGEGLWRGWMLDRRVAYNPHQHIAKNFIALVRAAFADAPQLPYWKGPIADAEVTLARATVDPEVRAAVAARIAAAAPGWAPGAAPLILINSNASDLLPQRRWPPERFAELARELHRRRPDALLLLTGSPDERAYVAAIHASAGVPRLIDFAGRTGFGELTALYSLAGVMVTNDSGPGHFAAVTDMPTVVLFGPETPALYGSLGRGVAISAQLACSPCVSAANHRKTPCTDPVCMRAIGVDTVVDAVLAQLDAPRAGAATTRPGAAA